VAGTDKARNKTEKVKGKAKQILGRVVRDPTLQTKGIDQQRKADLKDAGEKVKDVFRPRGPRRPR